MALKEKTSKLDKGYEWEEPESKQGKESKKVDKPMPDKAYGVMAVNEVKSALNSAKAALLSVKAAKASNKPIDVDRSINNLADELETLEALINTLL